MKLVKNDGNEGSGAEKRFSDYHSGLIEEALSIEAEDASKAGAVGYLTNVLVQATLPHKDPKLPPGTMYSRSTGRLSMSVVPTSPRYSIPYGSIPRVILAWLCTEAKRTRNRTIHLGFTQTEFLNKLNRHHGGSDIREFRKQAMMLFRSLISVEYAGEKVESAKRMLISDQDEIFWHPHDGSQTSLWESTLELSEKFFGHVVESGVPLDLRVYNALTRSPLAMDIYAWLVYRMYTLTKSSRPQAMIPWESLALQFGVGYKMDQRGMINFRSSFKKQLKCVLLFFPEASEHINETSKHLILTPCPLHISESKGRRLVAVSGPGAKT